MAGILRNIKFKSVKIDVKGIYKVPSVLITWELEPTTQSLRNLVFIVERGESPSEFQEISPHILASSRHEFIDHTAQLKDLHKSYYYRIKAHELSQGKIVQTYASDMHQTEDPPDLVALYIIEEHAFAFKYVYGVPAMVFIKKREGARCDCWDPILKRVTTSNCLDCKGVGFIEGYYEPMPAWMDFSPPNDSTSIAEFGAKQDKQKDILFIDHPTINAGDIILQLKPYMFWRVDKCQNTMKNQTTILQIIRISAINRSDIENSLTIDENIKEQLLKELRERSLLPEF